MNNLKMILTFVIMIAIISSLLYWIGNEAGEQKQNRIEKVEEGYKYSKGIITNMHSYKGHSIKIKYKIDGVGYEYSGGWDNNPKTKCG